MELPEINIKRVLLCKDCAHITPGAPGVKESYCRLRKELIFPADRACRIAEVKQEPKKKGKTEG